MYVCIYIHISVYVQVTIVVYIYTYMYAYRESPISRILLIKPLSYFYSGNPIRATIESDCRQLSHIERNGTHHQKHERAS